MKDNYLNRLWLAESIRLTEVHSGPLADTDINRKVRSTSSDLTSCILERARLLALRDGLADAQLHWLQATKLTAILLILLAILTGAGLAFTALGDGSQPVNIFWALGSLLGLNILTLLVWLLGALFTPNDIGSLLGRFWLWLTDKFSRNKRFIQLVPALMVLLSRQRATRWGVGTIVHSFWTVIQLSMLVILLLLLTTHHYRFTWETTLLKSETFIYLTHLLGMLPTKLGFPIPDSEAILASGNQVLDIELVRYSWAGWLIGVIIIYGLIPRVLLSLFCLLRWKLAVRKLTLDLTLPENIALAEKLQPSTVNIGITDLAPTTLYQPQRHQLTITPNGTLLTAIELDHDMPWPPTLPQHVQYTDIIDNRTQRHQLLDQLQATPVRRLLIACDALRSPDRGLINLLAELADKAQETRVWLLNEQHVNQSRLQHWCDALTHLQLHKADLHWLEASDD